jgi:hypothetical protein
MKSLGGLALLFVLGFYVLWPAYSGYEIRSALEARDPARLAAKVDFPSLRASLRPAVAVKVEKLLAEGLRKAGPAAGTLTDEIKARLMPRIIDGVLASVVTPEAIVRIYGEGSDVKEAIDRIAAERVAQGDALGELLSGKISGSDGDGAKDALGKLAEKIGLDPSGVGDLLGKSKAKEPATTEAKTAKPARHYGIENIKEFGLSGPFGVAIGIARDPKARKADLTVEMGFVDSDWKLTGLVPRT